LDIYLAAARGESAEAEADAANLMKIGALAKAVGVTVATIRLWTAEKRLEVADVTASGYQLYSPDMIARCELIRTLKEQRLTLSEIKSRLG
jgi:DNA-binding transcriptional MerR regulator